MLNVIKHFATSLVARVSVAREEGQALVEYSLILALVAVVLIGTLAALAGGIEAALNTVVEALEGV
jgi:Flp pilus assembly pilin Flp